MENNSPGGKNLFTEMVKYTDDKARKRKFRLGGWGKKVAFSEQTQVKEFNADPDPETEAYERVLKMNADMEEWRNNFLTTDKTDLSEGQKKILNGQIEKLIDTLTNNMSSKNITSEKKSEMVDVAEGKWEETKALYNFMKATQSKVAQGSPPHTEGAELETVSPQHIEEPEVGADESDEKSKDINQKIHSLIEKIEDWKENVFQGFAKSITSSQQTDFNNMTDALEVVITTLTDATKDTKKKYEEKEEMLQEGTDFFDEFKLEVTCRKNDQDRHKQNMQTKVLQFAQNGIDMLKEQKGYDKAEEFHMRMAISDFYSLKLLPQSEQSSQEEDDERESNLAEASLELSEKLQSMFGEQARNLFGRLTNIINPETKSNETEDNFTRMVQQDSKTFKVIQQKCKPEEKSIIEKCVSAGKVGRAGG